MKKIIALLLSVMIVLVPGTIATAEEGNTTQESSAGAISAVLDKLASYDTKQRAEMIAYLRPFITTDAGVDAAITNMQSGSMGLLIMGMLGDSVDEDTVIRLLKTFTCIKDDTGLRLEYADIFQNKIALSGANATTLNGVEKLMKAMYKQSASLEKICTEDDITPGVMANMLTIIPKINGDETILAFDGEVFDLDNVDATFKADFDAVWAGHTNKDGQTVTYEKVLYKFVDMLNNEVPDSDKASVAKALDNLKVCDDNTPGGTGGGGTGGGSTGGGNGSADKPDENKPVTPPAGGTENKDDNTLRVQFDEGVEGVVEIVTDLKNPVVTKVTDGKEEPVILSVPGENGVILLVQNHTANTEYVVTEGKKPFTDVNGWGKDYIVALANRGIINGMTETTFAPDANITREQFVTLVVKMFGLLDENATTPFADVKADAWYAPYVASAYKHGIVNGVSETEFGVGQNIKRQDMAKIINTVLTEYGIEAESADSSAFKDYDTIAGYARNHVLAICGLGIVSGDDNQNFNPNKLATRQEAAKMIYGMLEVYIQSLAE